MNARPVASLALLSAVVALTLLPGTSGAADDAPAPTVQAPATRPAAGPANVAVAPEDPQKTQVRTYSLAGIVSVARKQPNPQIGGGMFTNSGESNICFPAPADSQSDGAADPLIALIQETIEPESWRINGGTLGTARTLNSTLIVSQTPANHQAIATLLDQLRKPTVSVRAYWITLTPAELETLYNAKAKPADDDATDPAAPTGVAALPVVPDALLDDAHLLGQCQALMPAGQVVRMGVERARPIITDVTPVVGNNAVGYDPTMDTQSTSTRLDVLARQTQSPGEVLVDFSTAIERMEQADRTEEADASSRPPATRPAGAALTPLDLIDRAATSRTAWDSTVTLPLGKKILVGGMGTGDAGGLRVFLVLDVQLAQ